MAEDIEELKFGEDFGLPELVLEPLPIEIKETKQDEHVTHPFIKWCEYILFGWQNAIA